LEAAADPALRAAPVGEDARARGAAFAATGVAGGDGSGSTVVVSVVVRSVVTVAAVGLAPRVVALTDPSLGSGSDSPSRPCSRLHHRAVTARVGRGALARDREARMTVPPGIIGIQALRGLPEPRDQRAVLAILREMRGELAAAMGIDFTEFTTERVVATMPVIGNRQPFDLLHGGASAVLAETLGSVHAALTSGGRAALGVELNCSHHRTARDGLVTGISEPLYVGRTMSSFEIVISDESDRRVCTARLSCLLRDLPSG